jgi:trk system potassium uptake protein TrkA
VAEIQSSIDGLRVGFLTRYGEALLPTRDTAIQDGDQLSVLIRRDAISRVEEILGAAPEDHG